MNPIVEIIVLIGVGFVAGAINTLAGGGSLLTLPILIFLCFFTKMGKFMCIF